MAFADYSNQMQAISTKPLQNANSPHSPDSIQGQLDSLQSVVEQAHNTLKILEGRITPFRVIGPVGGEVKSVAAVPTRCLVASSISDARESVEALIRRMQEVTAEVNYS